MDEEKNKLAANQSADNAGADSGQKVNEVRPRERNVFPRRQISPFAGKAPFRTGRGSAAPVSEYDSKLLDLARVVRVSSGGKKMRFRAVVVVGNKISRVGVGVAKGLDVAQAVEKATRTAKKNIIVVTIKNGTIPHQVEAKYGAARILLRPQKKGRGLVAGGTVRIICGLAGIKNVSSKVLGRTSNKLNNAMATIKALKELKTD